MNHVQAELKQPERRVCRVLDQPRSTQRYTAVPRDGDEHLVRRLHELVRHALLPDPVPFAASVVLASSDWAFLSLGRSELLGAQVGQGAA